MLVALVGLIGCAVPRPGFAQAPGQVDRHPARPVSPDRVYELLATLSADSMEGRRTAEPGELRAARVIAAEMRAAGLEPAGDSSFFQNVPMAITTIVTVRDGQEYSRERLTLMADPSALDTIPEDRRKSSVNVVGILRGSDPSVANEHILVGAHHDHVGIGRAVNGDSIFNGADDDASGVVAVIEVARALAGGPRPRRTIVFTTTTGEESGLLGTRWYIADPVLPMDEMIADLQIEMIGRPDSLAGGVGRAWLTGYERSTMGDMLAANAIPIIADPRPEQNFFMRSDNIAFARIGIPAHTLSSFVNHAEYHSPDDEVELTDRDHMAAIIDATIQAVWQLANGPKPEWHPGMRPCAQGEQPQDGVCRN
jgi:Zn-dependent M28 family amino/carboxypeptidase